MKLPPLFEGRILSRYKRFLADIELPTGEIVTAHCPNTGAMTGCWSPGVAVQISASDNPKRKLKWTLERVDMGAGWVGVNTARVNQFIRSFIEENAIPTLHGYRELKSEPAYFREVSKNPASISGCPAATGRTVILKSRTQRCSGTAGCCFRMRSRYGAENTWNCCSMPCNRATGVSCCLPSTVRKEIPLGLPRILTRHTTRRCWKRKTAALRFLPFVSYTMKRASLRANSCRCCWTEDWTGTGAACPGGCAGIFAGNRRQLFPGFRTGG